MGLARQNARKQKRRPVSGLTRTPLSDPVLSGSLPSSLKAGLYVCCQEQCSACAKLPRPRICVLPRQLFALPGQFLHRIDASCPVSIPAISTPTWPLPSL
ncbi:hypothetical protein C4K40_1942 [Pseudomonas sp. CMR5c]|nr:hypothetical protein C4K40_1942 [Pseudomonas sp. CMR5c]